MRSARVGDQKALRRCPWRLCRTVSSGHTSQKSRLCTTIADASSISTATDKLASMPVKGGWAERRYVPLSIEKSPVAKRPTLNCRNHESNTIAPRSHPKGDRWSRALTVRFELTSFGLW